MIIRKIGLFANYLRLKWRYWGKVSFNGYTIIYSFPNSQIDIGNGTTINSDFMSNLLGLYQKAIIIARHGGKVKIGEGCAISGSTIYAMKSISIGDYTFIGANCKLIDNDFHPLQDVDRRKNLVEDIKKKEIEIGRGCFIGANSIILKGTRLGNNCVVGAGSVVSGTWDDNVIIAGNPAKIIRDNI